VPNNELRKQILSEIAAGATPKQCALKYNISDSTIRSWVHREKKNKGATLQTDKPATKRKKKNATAQSKEPVIKLEDVNEDLTEKQRLFCWLYIHNYNATMAARKAGYSEKTAHVIGYELLRNPKVRAEIERLKKLKAESIMLTEEDIVERYMRIAFADMTDFIDFGQEDVIIGKDDDGNEIKAKVNYLNFKDSNIVDGGLICEISKSRNGVKLKLEDRLKALQWLSDYFCMNPMSKHKVAYDNAILKMKERELKLKEF